jgi:hypothetical protein
MAFPRISLAEVLVAASVFCGYLAGLRFAGDLAVQIAVLVAALAFLFALMAAIFDRRSARAAGAGFAIGVALYGALFVAAGVRQDTDLLGFQSFRQHGELNFATASLPTTRLLEPVYNVVAVVDWEQTDTGETMSIVSDARGTMYDPWGRVFDPRSPSVPRTWRPVLVTPKPENFLALAQLGWAFLFGYFASLFARIAYARGRRRDVTASTASETDRA